MRLYTRTGDKGETGLIGGSRVRKDDIRVCAYGALDEVNASIGLARAACEDASWTSQFDEIQNALFVIGSIMAAPGDASDLPKISDDDVKKLETWIDEACAELPPQKHFILPGGCDFAARLHLARTVCRRAEREVVSFSAECELDSIIVMYLNRLADLVFAWARLANAKQGIDDIPWIPVK